MSDKQRYTYFFYYKGDKSPAFVTRAYTLQQAVKQVQEANPTKPVYTYFDNDGFKITREKFTPKPKAEPKGKGYKQLDFKSFALGDKPWPSA